MATFKLVRDATVNVCDANNKVLHVGKVHDTGGPDVDAAYTCCAVIGLPDGTRMLFDPDTLQGVDRDSAIPSVYSSGLHLTPFGSTPAAKMQQELKEAAACFPGWAMILNGLASTLYIEMTRNNSTCANFEFAQIKEKFGELRIYADNGNEVTNGLINMAEFISAQTCMTCGKRGKIQGISWLRAACPDHEDKPKVKA